MNRFKGLEDYLDEEFTDEDLTAHQAMHAEYNGKGAGEGGQPPPPDVEGEGGGEVKTPPAPLKTAAEAETDPKPADGKDGDDDDAGPGKQETVSFGRFEQERQRRKAADAELQTMKTQLAELKGRMGAFDELIKGEGGQKKAGEADKPKSPFEEPDVDPNVDYFAALEQERRRNKYLYDQRTQESRATEQTTAVHRMVDRYKSDATAYMATDPSYNDAYNFLKTQIDAELQALGMTDPNAREQAMNQRALSLISNAYQRNVNPAAVFVHLAKARGFTPKQPAENEQENPTVDQGNDNDVKRKALDNIEQIKSNQSRNRSMGGTGAGGGNKGLTPQMVQNMDEDSEEFLAFAKLPIQQRKKIGL